MRHQLLRRRSWDCPVHTISTERPAPTHMPRERAKLGLLIEKRDFGRSRPARHQKQVVAPQCSIVQMEHHARAEIAATCRATTSEFQPVPRCFQFVSFSFPNDFSNRAYCQSESLQLCAHMHEVGLQKGCCTPSLELST